MATRSSLWAAVIAVACVMAGPADADTMQELTTGGLSFSKAPGVSLTAQDVAITLDAIDMRYQLANAGKTPASVDMVLHLPSLDLSDPDTSYALPSDDPVNFLHAELTVDGQPADLAFRQTAEFEHKDVTKRLQAANLPLAPGPGLKEKLTTVAPEQLLLLIADGLLRANGTSQDGTQNFVPAWTVKTSAIHKHLVGPGQPVAVALKSLTSLGASQDTVLRKAIRQGSGLETTVGQVRKDYCIDDSFLGGIDKIAGGASDNAAGLQERRLAVALIPATAPEIPAGGFHLSIDKGKPDNLISTCLSNLKKTGSTTFELTGGPAPPHSVRILVIGKF